MLKLNILRSERSILDYRSNIGKSTEEWKYKILGQPVQPGIGNSVFDIIDEIDN